MREKLSKPLKVLALIVLLGGIGYNLWITVQFLLEVRIAQDPLLHGSVQLGIILASILLVPEMRSHSDRVLALPVLVFYSFLPGIIHLVLLVLLIGWLIHKTGGPARYYFILGVICSFPVAACWVYPSGFHDFNWRSRFEVSSWLIILGWIIAALLSGFLVQGLAKLMLVNKNEDDCDPHN